MFARAKSCFPIKKNRQLNSSVGRRPRRIALAVEQLDERITPSATITGTVFEGVDTVTATTDSNPEVPLQGVTVLLDGGSPQVTGAKGTYSFTTVTPGTHTVSLQQPLPNNLWGFTAQNLNGNTITVADGQTFANLNFSLTPRLSALVQNLYQQTLVRSSDLAGLNFWVGQLGAGGSTTGGTALSAFLSSSEFATLVTPVTNILNGFFPNQPLNGSLLRDNIQLERQAITPDALALNLLYSQPFVAAFGDTSQMSNTNFVSFLYTKLLHRNADPNGLAFWTGQLNGGADRGTVTLGFVGTAEFGTANPAAANETAVSLAYQGVLGRQADPQGFQFWVGKLAAGTTVAQLGDALLGSSEYAGLHGYNDLMLADIAAQPASDDVPVLNRLQMFDTTTGAFDKPVAAGSITGLTSTGAPANLYVITNGWSPGFAQDVLIHSTPNNPLKVWQTTQFPGGIANGSAAPWLFGGINQVSTSGLAQSIVDADPNAVVLVYSWLDDSATPLPSSIGSLTALRSALLVAQSEANTQDNGLRMASAIEQALSTNFFTNKGLIHLMGHSHGSKVATVAAWAMQQADKPVTQLTLFESPEDAPNIGTFQTPQYTHLAGLGSGQNFLWYYLSKMNLSTTPLTPGTRTPLNETFVDNYFSMDGVGVPQAAFTTPSLPGVVDVLLHPELLYGALDLGNLPAAAATVINSHTYPTAWYAQASLLTPNGLNWSPLINPAIAPTLSPIYQQNWGTTTPIFSQQYTLTTNGITEPTYTTSFSTLQFAEQYQVGNATVGPPPVGGGSQSITLGGGTSQTSLVATTFSPLSYIGLPGTGLSFQFQFTNPEPGDRLEIYTRGLAGTTSILGQPLTGNLGYISLQLFSMDGSDAGTDAQNATVSLDTYARTTVIGGGLSMTQLPLFSFALIHADGSTSSVTISNMQLFADGATTSM